MNEVSIIIRQTELFVPRRGVKQNAGEGREGENQETTQRSNAEFFQAELAGKELSGRSGDAANERV